MLYAQVSSHLCLNAGLSFINPVTNMMASSLTVWTVRQHLISLDKLQWDRHLMTTDQYLNLCYSSNYVSQLLFCFSLVWVVHACKTPCFSYRLSHFCKRSGLLVKVPFWCTKRKIRCCITRNGFSVLQKKSLLLERCFLRCPVPFFQSYYTFGPAAISNYIHLVGEWV